MTPDEHREKFADAFLAQARSDWDACSLLARHAPAPPCHWLHYLQMACEKLGKAYRLRETQSPVREVASHHSGFAKIIGSLLREILKDELRGKEAQFTNMLRRARAIAREIEKLAPAVDRKESPENVEYPWERGDEVITPCRHAFPSIVPLLQDAGGRAFLKLIARALDDFEQITSP